MSVPMMLDFSCPGLMVPSFISCSSLVELHRNVTVSFVTTSQVQGSSFVPTSDKLIHSFHSFTFI
eukprot:scaffold26303_cov69-Skeletonema_menzelii.AAC.1